MQFMTLAEIYAERSVSANLETTDEETDQIVAIRIFLHRVNVEVVERGCLGSDICNGIVSLVQRNVVAGIPGKSHLLSRLSKHEARDSN